MQISISLEFICWHQYQQYFNDLIVSNVAPEFKYNKCKAYRFNLASSSESIHCVLILCIWFGFY